MTFQNTLAVLFTCISFNLGAQNLPEEENINPKIKLRAVAEIGFLGVLDHKVQFSNSGTYFDYKRDGGQDVLFPIIRPSLELDINPRNTFILLYQPLAIETKVVLTDDLIVDDLLFPAGSGVKMLYNFPFYRFSYLRELLPNNPKLKFAIGPTVQFRNATISFESLDGDKFRTNRDLGIVPALKIRARHNITNRFYTELEADGIYAPVSYLNGSDTEIVGAILDASLRAGYQLTTPISAFFNVRYLGGGAVGTSNDNVGPGDGYVRNWLHFGTVSAGFVYSL
ncbi:hypothetical protein [Crocinitomix catalasitica]|uniref:hypothetical protein n=1 Tax=Crocinitomix catalasitica TaxID=184607 RepID=UPI00048551DB|nr:hypothetical protein [Crocinitomix catalasitica]